MICFDVQMMLQWACRRTVSASNDCVRREKTGEILLPPRSPAQVLVSSPPPAQLQVRLQRADSHPDIRQGGQVHLPGHGEWLGRHDLSVPVRGIFTGNNSLSLSLSVCRQLLVKTWHQFEVKIKIKTSEDFSYFWFSVISLPFVTG